VPVPSNPLEIRPARRRDAAEVAELVNIVTADWIGWMRQTEESIAECWASSTVDPARDVRVAVNEGIVGYAWLRPARNDPARLWLEVWSSPGSGRAAAFLEAELHRRADELAGRAAAGVHVLERINVEERQVDLREALEERGWEPVREFVRMTMVLTSPPPAPVLPDAVRVRSLKPEEDLQAVYELETDSLSETWEFAPEPFAAWTASLVRTQSFSGELCFVAEDAERIVGMLRCSADPVDPELGCLEVIGVQPPWRRIGLGEALLRHALARLYARGLRTVWLGTEANSPTGSERLAARCGFEVAQRFSTLEREVRAARPFRRALVRAARRIASTSASWDTGRRDGRAERS
jgi:mycothiol synthase